MAELTHYDLNEPIVRTAEFRVSGVLTDPTAVTVAVIKPNATETTYTYLSSVELTKTSVGVFKLSLASADVLGHWYLIWRGTGAAAAIQREEIIVDPRIPNDLLETFALVTVEEVEQYLDQVGSQGTQEQEADRDAFVAGLINSYSDEVRRYCRRQFKPLETAVAKVFNYDGSGRLWFGSSDPPSEARTVTSIVVHTDYGAAYQETLLAADPDFWLEPRGKTAEATYTSVVLPSYEPSVWAYESGFQVTVTGNWGAGVVPALAKYVVKAEIANAWGRSIPRTGAGIDEYGPVDWGPFALSRRSQSMLQSVTPSGRGVAALALRA